MYIQTAYNLNTWTHNGADIEVYQHAPEKSYNKIKN